MDKVDIEKAQRLLDQGMRRGEVAIRMGVTYNVISGMIARKVLKDPDTRKRCYVEYKPMLQRRPITKQEIEEYREILKIGDPVEGTEKFTEAVKPIDHMEAEEMEQLKAGCRTKRDRALIEWLRCTAMRKGEIPDVTINQIDWQKGRVMIYGSKGKAYRIVCLDSVAMKYLKEYIAERGLDLRSNQPLFTHCRGDAQKALSKSGIYSEIKRIAAASGLDRRVYPHLFRKTTATNIIRRGIMRFGAKITR